MDVLFINSKVAIIKVPSVGFIGDQIEIDKYAEYIGHLGNIKNVSVKRNSSYVDLIYVLKA